MPRDAAGTALPSERPRGPIMTDLLELLRLSGPVVLSRLGIMVMGLTDAIVVGHFSARAAGLPRHGLGSDLGVRDHATVGLLVGVQVMTARAMGAGNPHETGAVLRRGLSLRRLDRRRFGALLAAVRAAVPTRDGPEGRAGRRRDRAADRLLAVAARLCDLGGLSFWLEGLSRPTPGAVP
jgi:MATE family multidrug resistance protein